MLMTEQTRVATCVPDRFVFDFVMITESVHKYFDKTLHA